MKRTLRILALATAFAASAVWLGTGAHRGWTMTHVTVMEVEPVTGIDHPVTHDQFIMGVELLGAGMMFAGLLWGASLFQKTESKSKV